MLAYLTQRLVSLIAILLLTVATVSAQESYDEIIDSIGKVVENIGYEIGETDSIDMAPALQNLKVSRKDSLKLLKMQRKEEKQNKWKTWAPDPKRAMWLAMVIPGAGQIYNRKYWKLSIVYGGFVGCAYAMRWNDMMYSDYSRAYSDIMDNDPTTESYNQFLHLGAKITDANKSRYESIFKSRKDKYRRWRDMSFFCLIGVYALSIIDAYVDASLSQFDISDDLSLHVEPGFVGTSTHKGKHMFYNTTGLGVNCSLNF